MSLNSKKDEDLMTLDQVKRGCEIKILSIADDSSRSQLIRMGIGEGTLVTCHEKLPMGPVILKCKRQEIAVGRRLAEGITVE
ncbi:MAG: FeoA family protein [Armatimonadota bacterium]